MLAARVSVTARAPSNDARRTNADRRGSTCSTRSPSAVTADPVADGDVGAEVADPSRLVVAAAGQQRAPPTIDAGHTSRRSRGAERLPLLRPSPASQPSAASSSTRSHCHERAVTDVPGKGG